MKNILTLCFFISALFCLTANQSWASMNLSVPSPRTEPGSPLGTNVQEHNTLTEHDYFTMLDQVQALYEPTFQKLNIKFQIKKKWNSDLLNTQSFQDNNHFTILIHGGLARHKFMTVDSLALAACHEIGHFLGGAPRKTQNESKNTAPVSVEGQADYFASAKCLKKLFVHRSENRAAYNSLGGELKKDIQKICKSYECARIAAAGLAMAKTFESILRETPTVSLNKKETTVASIAHIEGHSSIQCRLDTYVAGATCNVSVTEDFDPYDLSAGACVRDSLDKDEAKSARPLCWFVENLGQR